MRLPKLRPRRKLSYVTIGAMVVVLVLGALVGAVLKPQLKTAFADGQYRTIRFSADHFLLLDASAVKIAGVQVGVVSKDERASDGTAEVTVKVNDDVPGIAGSQPSATLRPNTLLGGKYYIDLVPGGDLRTPWRDAIPVSRTMLPVELSDVTQSLQPDALAGARSAVTQLDGTLNSGGTQALQELLATAPATLGPTGEVLTSVEGTRPWADLPQLVGGLDATASTLTAREGQLESILANLNRTTTALANGSGPLATGIAELPSALDSADAGLARLRGTLAALRDTAGGDRPAVQQLTMALQHLDPVLTEAQPVVNDLRTAFADTLPVVQDLSPLSQRATSVLDNVDGQVLGRLNGPVRQVVLAPYQGTGPYQHTSGSDPFYQELAYMFSGLDATGAYVDPNGHAVAFQPGGGAGTVAGTGSLSLEQLYQGLINKQVGK